MTAPHDANASVERFLARAATLQEYEWVAIYWRYVHDPSILRSVRTFQNVATQAWIGMRVAMSADAKAAEDRLVKEANVRIAAIGSTLPEVELDAEHGGHLRQRIEWILTSTRMALRNAELLNSAPKSRKAVQRFLTVFAGMIEFPEFQ